MNKPIFAFVCLCMPLLASPYALACSFEPGYAVFWPDAKAFEFRYDETGEYVALLPQPKVTITNITRGTAAPGSSCADAGVLELTIDWPPSSVYELHEVAFYFRAPIKSLPDLIFPLAPAAPLDSYINGNKAKFHFVWLDGHPSQQKPLDFTLEVFAVNEGLEIGKSAKVRVKG